MAAMSSRSSPRPTLEYLAWPPGTGKTTACIEIFRERILRGGGGIDSRCFFVLPSREHAERIQHLSLKKGLDGLFNAHILTINDLAGHLLGSAAGNPPNDTVRRSVVAQILQSPDADWSAFRRVADIRGFHDLLVDAISELKSSRISPSALRKVLRRLPAADPLRAKLCDLTLVFEQYEDRMRRLGHSDPEDDLARLCREGPARAVDLILLDGFYHFSPVQQQLIASAARWCSHVVVTLTMDERSKRREGLFDYPERTRVFLEAAGFRRRPCPDAESKRTEDPALRRLTGTLFGRGPNPPESTPRSVVRLRSSDPQAEIETVGRRILSMRRDASFHFSDFCVIYRDIGARQALIESVFSRLGIPVAVHERRRLSQSGAVRLLGRVLRLVTEDWKREDVLAVLRSSCLRPRADAAPVWAVEAAALSSGIRSGIEAWSSLAADPSRLPPEASRLLADLLERGGRLAAAADASRFARELLGWVEPDRSSPLEVKALQGVEAILESARRSRVRPGAGPFDVRSLAQSLGDALDSGLYSARPAGKNRVQVYNAVMALPKEYRAVFVCGLTEGSFPRAPEEDPLFKDDERRRLARAGIALEERGSRDSGERYFFWMAVSRAREQLFLSHADSEGPARPCLPSGFVEEARRCLGGLGTPPRPEEPDREWLVPADALRTYARLLASGGSLAPPPGPGFARVAEWARRETTGALVRESSLRVIAGKAAAFSPTRLETFAVCAFRHFASRVLELDEPPEGRRERAMGTFLHRVLDSYFKRVGAARRRDAASWADPEILARELLEEMDRLSAEDPFRGEPEYRRKVLKIQMRRILEDFARVESRIRADRPFVPEKFEWSFGTGGQAELAVDSPEGPIRLRGTIDRIDVDPADGRALVVDYKLSRRQQSLAGKWREGLELQLPIYLLAAKRLLGVEPAGAELRTLKRRPQDKTARQGLYRRADADRLGLKPSSAHLDDAAFDGLLEEAESRIRSAAQAIRSGDIAARPKSCDHCPYDVVCRFEKWRLVYADEPRA